MAATVGHSSLRRGGVGLALALSIALTGCGSSSSSSAASASATAVESALPSASASALPSASPLHSLYLRKWNVNASAAISGVRTVPLVISEGKVLTLSDASSVEPEPLYVKPVSRTISQAGIDMIVALAISDGLLGSATNFSCIPAPGEEPALAGSGVNYIHMVVDGATHDLSSGDACVFVNATAHPGRPGWDDFLSHLTDLPNWLGAELGPEIPYDPQSLAVVTWVEEEPDPSWPTVDWPLSTPFQSFGDQTDPQSTTRCGLVSGADVAQLLPAIEPASAQTLFDDGTEKRLLTVRAVMPGETTADLCG